MVIRCELFTVASLTVLRTRGENFAARQSHNPQKSGARSIPGAACFGCNGFVERSFNVGSIYVACPKESWRRTFQGPVLHLVAVFRLHDQLDVGVSPVD